MERRQPLIAEDGDNKVAVYYAAHHAQQSSDRLRAEGVFTTIPTEIATAVCSERRFAQKKIEFRRRFATETCKNNFGIHRRRADDGVLLIWDTPKITLALNSPDRWRVQPNRCDFPKFVNRGMIRDPHFDETGIAKVVCHRWIFRPVFKPVTFRQVQHQDRCIRMLPVRLPTLRFFGGDGASRGPEDREII